MKLATFSQQQNLILLSLCSVCLLLLMGCSSSGHPTTTTANNSNWLKDGSIVIARPLPSVSTPSPQTMLGFLPVQGGRNGIWLSINTLQSTISLMNGEQVIAAVSGEGTDNLKPGLYQALHKQRNALWHASDAYFHARRLKVPPEGDRARFRRGALGEFVIFINKDTPIHSGPVWSKDIGGVKLAENDLSRIYYQLNVGSLIEVQ